MFNVLYNEKTVFYNTRHYAIRSTPCRSVVLNVELVPNAERVQDSEGRIVNGVEQRILNINIYKGTRLKHELPYYYTIGIFQQSY